MFKLTSLAIVAGLATMILFSCSSGSQRMPIEPTAEAGELGEDDEVLQGGGQVDLAGEGAGSIQEGGEGPVLSAQGHHRASFERHHGQGAALQFGGQRLAGAVACDEVQVRSADIGGSVGQ